MFARLAPLLLAFALAAPASAQIAREDDAYRQAVSSYPVEALAGVMGELHFLAFSCQGEDSQDWRATMMEMLELEAPTRGPYRERLIGNFNEGFRYHERRRTRCGAEAEAERQRLAVQGRALSETLRRSYID